MAYVNHFIKLTWGGTMASNEEIWTCGLHLAYETATDVSLSEFNSAGTNIVAISDLIKAMHQDADVRVPAGVQLEWVKLALIGNDGKYLTAPIEYILPTAAGGGRSSAYVPQVAMVCTLVSDKYKDPGKYGRFYLPASSPSGSSGFKLTILEADGAAGALGDFITGLNAIFEPTDPGIEVSAVAQGVAAYRSIRTVRVGTVLDTQRRRRNKITEEYAEEPVAL